VGHLFICVCFHLVTFLFHFCHSFLIFFFLYSHIFFLISFFVYFFNTSCFLFISLIPFAFIFFFYSLYYILTSHFLCLVRSLFRPSLFFSSLALSTQWIFFIFYYFFLRIRSFGLSRLNTFWTTCDSTPCMKVPLARPVACTRQHTVPKGWHDYIRLPGEKVM
jgi:hypothetical protein